MSFIQESRVTETALDTAALVEQIRQRFGLNVHRRTVERVLARSKKKRL